MNDSVGGSLPEVTEPGALPETTPLPETILNEAAAVKAALLATHNARLRFVIWAGPVNPDALGVLKGGPRSYILDSNDPEKLKAIVEDMQRRSREPIAKLLPSTLVIGKSMAAEHIAGIYRKFSIDPAPNFITLDEPRAFLFALTIANQDAKAWADGWTLLDEERADAMKLADFLHRQSGAGKDKVTLLLPESWGAAGAWTRRIFEGVNLIAGEKPNPRQYHWPTEPVQDRVFVVVQKKGETDLNAQAVKNMRHAGYPIAALTFSGKAPLSHYQRFMETTAAALRGMRTGVETEDTREALAAELLEEAKRAGGIDRTEAWKNLPRETPKTLAASISSGARSRAFRYGEIAFFGDLRYAEHAAAIRRTLDAGARLLFRTPYKMPGTVLEAPAELSMAQGGGFSILILSAAQARFALAAFEPDAHVASFLATKLALEGRRRLVRAILVKDFSLESMADLEEFFSQTAQNLTSGKHGEIQSR